MSQTVERPIIRAACRAAFLGAILSTGTIALADPYPYPPNPTIGGLPATIDVMVLYTQTAERNFELANPLLNPGDPPRAEGEIGEAIAYLNAALVNSGVQASVNLVGTRCICTTDTTLLADPPCGACTPDATLILGAGDGETLANLSTPGPSVSGIHDDRDANGADLVMLVSHGGNVTGIAGAPLQFSTAFDSEAYGIVFVGNQMTPTEDRTFAHELGHLLGAQHDWYQTDSRLGFWDVGDDEFSPSVDYQHGHVDVDETANPVSGFYTIMSYADLCAAEGADCRAIPNFSNPNVNDPVTGRPTGVADHAPDANYYNICLAYPGSLATDDAGCPADVASLFNTMAPYVAAYRSIGGPDGKPSDVTVTQTAPRSLRVTWTDGVTNEAGFRIFRSKDSGLNWTYLSSIGADGVSFLDTIDEAYRVTAPWNEWRYRVQAYDAQGMSTYVEGSVLLDPGCTGVDIDFEDAPDLTVAPWVNDPLYPYRVTTGTGGNHVLQSFAPNGSSEGPARITWTGTVGDGFVCFDLSTMALMQVRIDGGATLAKGAAWSFVPVTTRFAVPVPASTHTFTWELVFNSFDTYPPAFLDNIDFPAPAAAPLAGFLPSLKLLLDDSTP